MTTVSISAQTRLLGVTGWPVAHSLSPPMHNAALHRASIDCVYAAFPIAPEDFETAVRGLAASGLLGLNCTIPHKHAAFQICDTTSKEAAFLQAVNTLHFREGKIYGGNTDVEGYVESLRHEGRFDPTGKRVAQIGAGGAGKAMALGILKAGAAELTLINRSLDKARQLADELQRLFPAAVIRATASRDAPEAGLGEADLVSNATSLGLHEADALPCDPAGLGEHTLVFDAIYRRTGETPWLEAAKARGLATVGGRGMLVRQGAASLRIWLGIEPDLDSMFQALDAATSQQKEAT